MREQASPLNPKKERNKQADDPREGWEDGTPPPQRDFKTAQCRASHAVQILSLLRASPVPRPVSYCMYVCSKVKNSQARTGHQRGMGGRWTDDDDTHERHTDTNKLTRHTASWLPHTLSRRTHNSGPHPPCRPPQHSTVPRAQTRAQLKQQTTGSDM